MTTISSSCYYYHGYSSYDENISSEQQQNFQQNSSIINHNKKNNRLLITKQPQLIQSQCQQKNQQQSQQQQQQWRLINLNVLKDITNRIKIKQTLKNMRMEEYEGEGKQQKGKMGSCRSGEKTNCIDRGNLIANDLKGFLEQEKVQTIKSNRTIKELIYFKQSRSESNQIKGQLSSSQFKQKQQYNRNVQIIDRQCDEKQQLNKQYCFKKQDKYKQYRYFAKNQVSNVKSVQGQAKNHQDREKYVHNTLYENNISQNQSSTSSYANNNDCYQQQSNNNTINTYYHIQSNMTHRPQVQNLLTLRQRIDQKLLLKNIKTNNKNVKNNDKSKRIKTENSCVDNYHDTYERKDNNSKKITSRVGHQRNRSKLQYQPMRIQDIVKKQKFNKNVILSTQPFLDRQNKTIQNKKLRVERTKKQNLERQIEECTFKPVTNHGGGLMNRSKIQKLMNRQG